MIDVKLQSLNYKDRAGIMKIVVAVFRDNVKRSLWYREFKTVEGATKFYSRWLGRPEVHVISTRKVEIEKENCGEFVEKCSRCGSDSIMHEQNH